MGLAGPVDKRRGLGSQLRRGQGSQKSMQTAQKAEEVVIPFAQKKGPEARLSCSGQGHSMRARQPPLPRDLAERM